MQFIREILNNIPTSFLAMITVINPLGTGLVLDAMTSGIDAQAKLRLAKKILINCLGLFLVVLLFGNFILAFFGLSLPIIRVAGGFLLASMGWNMLNAREDTPSDDKISLPQSLNYSSKAFYPFTFPVTAGPGSIAVALTFAVHHGHSSEVSSNIASLLGTFIGLIGVSVVVYLCYVYSNVIAKKLGESGAHALNRMMAFITLCIGFEIVWAGVKSLLAL